MVDVVWTIRNQAVHLGCDEKRNGHLVYIPYLNRITTGYHLAFQERKFLKFTAEGIVNIPRNVRPLNTEGVERSYREKRDHTTHEDERTTHEDVEVPGEEGHEPPPRCGHPDCDLPRHSPDEPHSFERFPGRNKGRNAPR